MADAAADHRRDLDHVAEDEIGSQDWVDAVCAREPAQALRVADRKPESRRKSVREHNPHQRS